MRKNKREQRNREYFHFSFCCFVKRYFSNLWLKIANCHKVTQLHVETTTGSVKYRFIVIQGNFIENRVAWLTPYLGSRMNGIGDIDGTRKKNGSHRNVSAIDTDCTRLSREWEVVASIQSLLRFLFGLIRLDTWCLITRQINLEVYANRRVYPLDFDCSIPAMND